MSVAPAKVNCTITKAEVLGGNGKPFTVTMAGLGVHPEWVVLWCQDSQGRQ